MSLASMALIALLVLNCLAASATVAGFLVQEAVVDAVSLMPVSASALALLLPASARAGSAYRTAGALVLLFALALRSRWWCW